MIIQSLSVLRTSALAREFGAGYEMDAMNLANIVMVCIVNIGGATIPVTIIPYLAKIRKGREKNEKALNTFVFTVICISGGFLVLSYTMIAILLYHLQAGTENRFVYLTALLILIMGFGQFARMLSWIQTAYLETAGKFIVIKLAALTASLVSYVYILVKPHISIYETAVVIGGSIFIEFFVLFIANRRTAQYRFKFQFDFKDKEYRELLKRAIPCMFSSALYQVTILIPNFAAGFFGEGYISTMTYANQIYSIFQTLIVLNLLSMMFPILSRSFVSSYEKGREQFYFFSSTANMLVYPVAVGLIILSPNLVHLLFEHGDFTAESGKRVVHFVIFLAASLPFITLKELIFKSFYSIGDTLTPMINSTITMCIQIVFLLAGIYWLGLQTLIISPLFVAIFSVILGYIKLNQKIYLQTIVKKIVKTQLLSLLNASMMGGVIYFVLELLNMTPLLSTIICFVIGVVFYAFLVILTQRKFIQTLLVKEH